MRSTPSLHAGYWGHLRAQHGRGVSSLFLRAFLPFLGMLLIAAMAAFTWRMRALDRDLDRTVGTFLDLTGERLQNDLRTPVEDLRFLAAEWTRGADRSFAASDGLRHLARARNRYTTIRVIDTAGRETLRVEGMRPNVPVVRGELADWSRSNLFAALASLRNGDLHMSTFELRSERGRIVEPFEPIVRFAAPLSDGTQRSGYLVIELDARPTLDALKIANPNGFLELLTADGYWIKARDAQLEWGGVLREREHSLFSIRNARAWGAMSSNANGTVRTDNGGFWYRRLEPSEPSVATPHWILVLHVPQDRLRLRAVGMATGFGLVALVAALMAAPFYWWLARRALRASPL